MKLMFDANNSCTDICKTIFVILEVQFHHEGGHSETRYFELFFSTWSIFSPYQKSASAEAPFNLFWTLTMILDIFLFWKSYAILLVQNLGHNLHKKSKIVIFGASLSEKQPFTFRLFVWRLKPLLNTLTNSAMPENNLFKSTISAMHNLAPKALITSVVKSNHFVGLRI